MVNHSDLSEWLTNDHNQFLGNSLVRRVPVICDGKDCFVIEVSFEPRMAGSYCHVMGIGFSEIFIYNMKTT